MSLERGPAGLLLTDNRYGFSLALRQGQRGIALAVVTGVVASVTKPVFCCPCLFTCPCRLQRQVDVLLASFWQIEAKLQAKGSSLSELGVTPPAIEVPGEYSHSGARVITGRQGFRPVWWVAKQAFHLPGRDAPTIELPSDCSHQGAWIITGHQEDQVLGCGTCLPFCGILVWLLASHIPCSCDCISLPPRRLFPHRAPQQRQLLVAGPQQQQQHLRRVARQARRPAHLHKCWAQLGAAVDSELGGACDARAEHWASDITATRVVAGADAGAQGHDVILQWRQQRELLAWRPCRSGALAIALMHLGRHAPEGVGRFFVTGTRRVGVGVQRCLQICPHA